MNISEKKKNQKKSEMRTTIQKTDFRDPYSTVELESKLNGISRYGSLCIGRYLGAKTYHYSVQFAGHLFPADFLAAENDPRTAVTHIKCDPPSISLPKFFVQIGRLRCSYAYDPDQNAAAPNKEGFNSQDTYFVVAANVLDRQAWALWNPDQFESVGGILPGFQKVCTAIPFNQTIDDLMVNLDLKVLNLDLENMVALPPATTVRYGWLDSEGWTELREVLSSRKQVANAQSRRWST